MKNAAESVLAKLKNISIEKNVSLQQLLNLFCQEEFLRRLSISKYKNNLILKGGYLLYSISNFTSRPTIDSDYLIKDYSNSIDKMKRLVNEIISTASKNEFIQMEIRDIDLINELKEYHGVRVTLVGTIGKTKTPFSIDFGVGDVVIPVPTERTLPVLIQDFEKPKVLTYTLESTVSEKLDAIISLMELTGRMQDLYDIYYIATTFNLGGRKLQEAIYETLTKRGRAFERNSVIDILRLAKSTDLQKRWLNFCNKVLKYDLDFLVEELSYFFMTMEKI